MKSTIIAKYVNDTFLKFQFCKIIWFYRFRITLNSLCLLIKKGISFIELCKTVVYFQITTINKWEWPGNVTQRSQTNPWHHRGIDLRTQTNKTHIHVLKVKQPALSFSCSEMIVTKNITSIKLLYTMGKRQQQKIGYRHNRLIALDHESMQYATGIFTMQWCL